MFPQFLAALLVIVLVFLTVPSPPIKPLKLQRFPISRGTLTAFLTPADQLCPLWGAPIQEDSHREGWEGKLTSP